MDLQAVPVAAAITCDKAAWLYERYITVRLTAPLEALRVHTAGRSFPGRDASAQAGAWILIGDVIHTSGNLASNRSLPTINPRSMTAFTHTSEALLAPGTVLNIGIANAKFGGAGGGFQGEYVTGPAIVFMALSGKHWHGSEGHA